MRQAGFCLHPEPWVGVGGGPRPAAVYPKAGGLEVTQRRRAVRGALGGAQSQVAPTSFPLPRRDRGQFLPPGGILAPSSCQGATPSLGPVSQSTTSLVCLAVGAAVFLPWQEQGALAPSF